MEKADWMVEHNDFLSGTGKDELFYEKQAWQVLEDLGRFLENKNIQMDGWTDVIVCVALYI